MRADHVPPLTAATGSDPIAALEAKVDSAKSANSASRWRLKYQRGVRALDLASATIGILIAWLVSGDRSGSLVEYLSVSVALPLGWLFCASLNRAYETRFLGAGTVEFERVGRAFLQLTAIVTFTAYATQADLSRSMILSALLLTLVISTTGRLGLRHVLHGRRRSGRATVPVLAVGSGPDILSLTDTLQRNGSAGFTLVGACIPLDCDRSELSDSNIDTFGDIDSVREAVEASGAHVVAVVSSDLTGEKLRWISWQLEGTETDLVVLPGLTEVAGRRLELHQVGGLPLLYVAQPEFKGIHRIIKGGFDRVVSAILLLLGAPFLLGIAAIVKLTSRGPALYRQTRVGKDGSTFRMIKFRSMCVGAEKMVDDLADRNEAAGGVVFKIKDDPRITRVGSVLRRYSLDELPQLINVLTGSMSLVGPRPPLPNEVEQYGYDAQRRLLVKPGLTGLWQVSGRSDLSWEDSVRLDLRYVENWSLSLDVIVLCRTLSAVVQGRGAY